MHEANLACPISTKINHNDPTPLLTYMFSFVESLILKSKYVMEITTKYVVLEEKYANWIIGKAKNMYSSLYNDVSTQNELDRYIETTYELKNLVQSQNDFTIQTIMAFYNDQPIASIVLHTFPRNRDHFKNVKKPLFIDKIMYDTLAGLDALLEKVKAIASQQRYDLIFGKILAVRNEGINAIEKNGFEITSEKAYLGNTKIPAVIFKKTAQKNS